MNRNRDHANRPTGLTSVDRVRQRAAIARHDATLARQRRNARLQAAGYWIGAVTLAAVLFYNLPLGA